jgi:hypothetical protein
MTMRPATFITAAFLATRLVAAVPPVGPTKPVSFEKEVTPLLQKYCYDCHGDGAHKAGLALDDYETVADVHAARPKWEAVLRNVSRHEMPPDDGGVLPSDTERETISRFVEQELFKLDPAHPDPGRVVLRRLNRAEYNTTIRDLTGIDFRPANDFPPDDSGYGFDNIGAVLSLPPVLLEKYLAAADKIFDTAIVTDPIKSETRRIPASLSEIGFNAIGDRGDGWVHLISLEEDDTAVELNLPAGDYNFRVLAYATRDGGALKGQGSEAPLVFNEDPGPTKLALMLNDAFVRDFTIATDEAHPQVYETRLGVPAGRQRFRASVARKRGGLENETFMLNGRLGQQQPGIVFVKWLEIEGPLPAATRRYRADQLAVTGEGTFTPAGERVLRRNGTVTLPFTTAKKTEVILRAQGYANQAGDEPARMEFRVDGVPLKTFDVLAPATMQPIPKQRVFSLSLLVPRPYVYEVRTQLAPGAHQFSAAFVNDFADPKAENPNLRDRNLIIQNLEVSDLSAPVVTPEKPAPLAELFARAAPVKDETARARAIVSTFTRRAWRRPVEPAEIERLMKLYAIARADGESFDAGVKLALKAAIISPHFLFLGEDSTAAASLAGNRVQRPATPRQAAPPSPVVPLDEFTLASRLSYFLWSSTPDDELLDLAGRGRLRANFAAQVRRLLASPKARALVDNFAGQWLQIRSLETFAPDKKLFPEFDPLLRSAMQRETELFFENVLREDRSVFDFLTGDYTFVNARLAKLYGLPFPASAPADEFAKISLARTPRRGVLTQASVLTLTSNPTRTSPVKRGKWVLENILGTPPPPPPPNVPELDDKSRQLTGSLRQQLEQHRANPTCASCHARMDPIGFGLENFNAIGVWREKDGDAPVDPAGQLASGDKFDGAAELATLLAQKRRWEFLHCVAERTLTYALGRGTEYYDRPALDQIVERLEKNGDTFSALVLAVAESFPFQNRRGATPVVAVTVETP